MNPVQQVGKDIGGLDGHQQILGRYQVYCIMPWPTMHRKERRSLSIQLFIGQQ
jgi:hypothetical protein